MSEKHEFARQYMPRFLVQMVASIVDPASAVYAAGPLETCRELYEARLGTAAERREVRSKNQERLTAFSKLLRANLSKPVIDPGIFHCPEWDGPDYGGFFVSLLETFCCEAWFIDGWEYSSGATKEFVVCQHRGLPCFSERGELLNRANGIAIIGRAAICVEGWSGDPTRLLSRVAELELGI